MDWIRTHPYPTALALAVLLVLAGAGIVSQRSAVAPQNDVTAWSGNEKLFQDPLAGKPKRVSPMVQNMPVQNNEASHIYVSPFISPPGTEGADTGLATLIDMLKGERAKEVAKTTAPKDTAPDAYSFIPGGSISIGGENEKKMTPVQKALRQYGNDVGDTIRAFENMHENQAQTLKNFAEDRTNEDKAAAQKKLGDDYASVGESMTQVDAPAQIQTQHHALAESYKELGAKLAAISTTRTDSDFIAAAELYDKTAEKFARNFVAIAQLFTAYQVEFTNDEGGSVFMLPLQGSL